MNQEKIGKFIAECRHEKDLTQEELGEAIGVSNRTISRWENGDTMPDISMYEDLTKKLGITITELLSAKRLDKDNYNEEIEKNIFTTIDHLEKNKIKEYFKKVIFYVSLFFVILVSTLGIIHLLKIDNTIELHDTEVNLIRLDAYKKRIDKIKWSYLKDDVQKLIDRYEATSFDGEVDVIKFFRNFHNEPSAIMSKLTEEEKNKYNISSQLLAYFIRYDELFLKKQFQYEILVMDTYSRYLYEPSMNQIKYFSIKSSELNLIDSLITILEERGDLDE